MMIYWLVTVTEFSVIISKATMLKSWDWECLTNGVVNCYRIAAGGQNMPKNGNDRAQVEIMYHARNLAGDAPIIWKMRGKAEKTLTKKQAEIQSKMKRMF